MYDGQRKKSGTVGGPTLPRSSWTKKEEGRGEREIDATLATLEEGKLVPSWSEKRKGQKKRGKGSEDG